MEIFAVVDLVRASLGERVKAIRVSRKMTQKEFSSSLGIVQGFLSSIEKGRKVPSTTLMIAIQHLYSINQEWLKTGVGDMYLDSASCRNSVDIKGIPLFQTTPVSPESLSSGQIKAYISMPQVPDGCFAFEYSGDFMYPTIRDGDIVIMQPCAPLDSGDIILLEGQWGDSFLRRYRKVGDEIYCSSDNTSYSSFRPNSGTKILGKVCAVWRKVKI